MIYLKQLIDELKDLWGNSMWTYDVYKNEYFHMPATILWTISDFLSHMDLSRWITKRIFAYPNCNVETSH